MIIKEHNVLVSSKFWVIDLDFSEDYLKTMAVTAKRVKQEEAYKTNVVADMSSWRIWEQTDVFNYALTAIDKYCMEVVPGELFLQDDETAVTKTYEAWTAVYRKGDYAKGHTHCAALLSWVFYIQADPELDQPLLMECVSTTGERYKIPAQSNRLIIFPGTLGHAVDVQRENTERIVLAGNVSWQKS